ncbi:glycosyltransferase [[Ruminococcus] lactaris]|uniref:glycosyltransferase n=1 Tax=[Ruminococcus] lactaris TaxID=46228 RepID=UPI003FD76DA3
MSELIGKIKEKGIRQSVRMISVKMKKQEKWDVKNLRGKRKNAIDKLLSREFDTVIIFENHFGFYNIMLQRPQHLTKKLADERTLVLYNSYYDVDYKNPSRITRVAGNCFVLDLYYYRNEILRQLRQKRADRYLMVYSTDTVPMSRIRQYQEEGFKILYEYVDDINPDLIAPGRLDMILERHEFLIKDPATYVIATATRLYENVRKINPAAKTALISNGAECEKFPPDQKTEEKEYLSWLRSDSVKAGYYGAMASWVDYDLLKALADHPKIQIILIGIEHDASLQESGILEYKNVRFLGKRPYEELAGYAHFFDVCMIPFVVNDITESTSPVKLFEYMAMGKPVVATSLPECKKYELVKIADTKEDFVEDVLKLAEKGKSEDFQSRLMECARANDWKAKAAELKDFIKEGRMPDSMKKELKNER